MAMDQLLPRLGTFVRVVESGSLSAAARALRLSLPAVSRQIAALEAGLGATLLLRTTRRLTVTEAGRTFYERSLRVLREVEEAQDSVRSSSTPSGKVTITAPVTWGLTYLTSVVQSAHARYPALQLDVRLEDRLVDLVGDGVDIAVRAGVPPPDSAQIVASPLLRFRRLPVASPRYLRRHGTPGVPDALARHEALVQIPEAAPLDMWRFERAGVERSVAVRGRFRSNVPQALRQAALAGLGIALLPEWLVTTHLATRRLRALLPDWSTPPVSVYALQRADLRGSARVRAALDLLRGAVAAPE
jgi:DNA-binding transcriptional LysR family regulator